MAIRKESKLKSTICPGDFVYVAYDTVPIIEDMHCDGGFNTAIRDNQVGGRNDWFIESFTKYSHGGFMVKAKRKLRTKDKLDWQLKGEPEKVLYGLHESSYELVKPEKTGYRGFEKYENYNMEE